VKEGERGLGIEPDGRGKEKGRGWVTESAILSFQTNGEKKEARGTPKVTGGRKS